ncbi:copper resistance CopC family protein [Pseudidiomarina sp. E22-M8]|uniref:copper resistance CopC family protein n=1 Tax=Pseudidiomarina sp. E22-M8 TaxID=3424768 RepID=UPI00403C2C81
MKNVFKVLLVISFFYSACVQAHVDLVSSIPMEGSALTKAPSQITLNFSGEVRLAKVMLHMDNGKMISLDFAMSMKPDDNYTIAIKDELGAGDYTVNWVAMGGDSHKISGDFSFKVKQ